MTDEQKYISSYHYTKNGHCYISGVTGGYVETDDNGAYFTDMDKAIPHRIERIKFLYSKYGRTNL